MDTRELGNLGEKLACEYLVKNGFSILGKNWRISLGEIDIIAKKKWRLFARSDKTIHFIEVKTAVKNDGHFFPEDRVDAKKQHKLKQLIQIWFQKHRYRQDWPCQIDVVGIAVDQATRKATLKYIPNAVEN